MNCEICKEKEATHKISIPDYKGNAAKNRCEECLKIAENSYENLEIKKIN